MKANGIHTQSGFTLMELVTVMVVLGILAATVIPNVVDMSGPARVNTLKSVAAQITGASETNYAAIAAGGSGTTAVKLCSNAGVNLVLQTPLDATIYTVGGTSPVSPPLGTVFTCTLCDSKISPATSTGGCSAPISLNIVAVP